MQSKKYTLMKNNVVPMDKAKGEQVILEAEKKMWTMYFSNGSRISCLADGLEAAIELINPNLKRNIISARSAADKD